MIKNLLFAGLVSLFAVAANAQCLDWVDPNDSLGYTDFDPMPCNGFSQEFTSFEVWKSEAYTFLDVVIDGNYTFSICNGPGAGSWVPEFTVIAPSGEVDAFGAGDGDGCSITWTATENGTYLVVINEADNCGVAEEANNGYPMITTNSGASEDCVIPLPPPVFVEGAESFEGDSLPNCWQAYDEDGDGFNWVVTENGNQAFDGTNLIISRSWINGVGALDPDNYLVTPQMELGTNDSLYYIVGSASDLFGAENYSVLVSTTGSDIADFTDEIFTETLETADWQGRSLNLSAYDNEMIYIAFRHHDVSDEEYLKLDAISLPGVVAGCLPISVSELDKVESSIFPNPATDILNITSALEGAAAVSIFDALGRIVLQKNVNLSQATYTQNIAALENGVYIIQISTSDKIATQRFVKR